MAQHEEGAHKINLHGVREVKVQWLLLRRQGRKFFLFLGVDGGATTIDRQRKDYATPLPGSSPHF